MNFVIREIAGLVLYFIGYPFLNSKISFLSLYFHNPSSELFERIVLFGKKKGYRFIDINECYDIILNKKKNMDKILFISFDDGWQSNMKLLPIIEKYGVPITVFVSIEPIINGNFWWEYAIKDIGYKNMLKLKKIPYDQFCKVIKKMKKSVRLTRSAITEDELLLLIKHPFVSIQSHTITHPLLTACDNKTLVDELENSKNYLEKISGKEIIAFSYPNGSLGEREIKAVKTAGYKMAFTTVAKHVDVQSDSLYLIPRMAMNTYGGYYENLAKIIGIWQHFIK